MRISPVIHLLCSLALSDMSFGFVSSPLEGGAEFHADLSHGEIICHTLAVPQFATRVSVRASVVGLTGNPNLFGGWDQKEIMMNVQSNLAPTNAGGYHILSESVEVPPEAISYYLCITTFSTQGSDFVLTAAIWDAFSWTTPHATLIDGYPTVWRLDDTSVDYADFRLPIQSYDNQLTVSVTPLSGEVDIRVSDCSSAEVFGVSSSLGADVLSITIPSECESVCIRAHGTNSEFALVATTNSFGPFVAQSIPISGKLPGVVRAYFNPATDVIVQTNDEFKITADVEPLGEGVWSSYGLLDIPKSALEKFSDKNVLYLRIHSPEEKTRENEIFTVSVTTFNTVEQLEDGKPTHVTIDTPNRFRDFRFWVPKSSKILTIQGDSSEDGSGLGLFASTVRTSHDPRGYMWNTMTGTNDLVLTTDESMALSKNIPFIEKCESGGCYVYLSVKSCAVHQGLCKEGDSVSKFTLTGSLDTGPLLLEAGRESRTVFSGTNKKLLVVPEKDRENENLLLYFFVREGEVTITVSDSKSACGSNSGRCVVTIDHNNPSLKPGDKIEVVVASENGDYADIQVSYRYDSESTLLKNHHSVGGKLTDSLIDRYRFVVPREAENSMMEFSGPEGVTCTICESEDCTSITTQGIIHLKKTTGQTVSVKVESETDTDEPYTLTPSFFSSFNSLRVGYLPVTVAVEKESKMSWQIGYSESSEWLVTIDGATAETEICIADMISPRCCEQGTLKCVFQGFGRQVVWVDNKSQDRLFFSLQAEELVALTNEKWIDVKDRKSNVFKLPSVLSRIDTDPETSVEYLSNSISNPTAIGNEYPRDFKGEVFARIPAGSTRARLVIREPLFADQWLDNSYWSFVERIENFFVRVESCGGDEDLVVNGKTICSADRFVDITGETSVEVEGSEFRVGLISGQKVDFEITLSALIDPLVENSNGFIYFTAPPNADKTTYRALCLSASTKPSQCIIEHSPKTMVGPSTGCSPESYCEVPLPSGCEGFVTVVADKGTGYGAFAPLPVRALLGEGLVEPTSSSGLFGFIGWTLKKLLYIVALYVIIKSVYANRILIRIAAMRMIDIMRGKRKRGDYLLVEEMSNIESGGYKAFGETAGTNRNLNHRSAAPPLIRPDNHEMYHLASSNRIYHGA